MQLPEALRKQKEDFTRKAPAEVVSVMNEATKKLSQSGILKDSLTTGETAPDFTLTDWDNTPINLYDQVEKGPVILKFFRGDWCPYCNLELQALQQKFAEIQSRGVMLLSVSPLLKSLSKAFVNKLGLAFPVLSDQGNNVAKKYGLVYTIEDSLQPIYANFGIDLSVSNGDSSQQLPLPATYIINQEAVITFCFVDADYTIRLDPEKMLHEVDKILEI